MKRPRNRAGADQGREYRRTRRGQPFRIRKWNFRARYRETTIRGGLDYCQSLVVTGL